MSKALIVEDESSIASELSGLLTSNGWIAEVATSGADCLQMLDQFSYDLLLLDWNLPDITGLEICKKFRAGGGVIPIIFITGQSGIDYKESGFDAGSDDYITKPFDGRELMARIRNVMRRPQTIVKADAVSVGTLSLNTLRRTLSEGEKAVQLTQVECNLLDFLARHSGQAFTTAQLFASVWHSDSESSEETVRVHIRVLRRKLELAGLPPILAHRRGFGYSIATP
ncbi:MAG: response regulator transcription factor [Cyanobacteria bacterium REEB67]|nr:response regulator transcription factor [Cyanobacteria bacterium REEB67]